MAKKVIGMIKLQIEACCLPTFDMHDLTHRSIFNPSNRFQERLTFRQVDLETVLSVKEILCR